MKRGLLFSLLLSMVDKNAKLAIAKKEFEIEKELNTIENSIFDDRKNDSWYKKNELTEIENQLIEKRFELSKIEDSLKLAEFEVSRKVEIANAKAEAEIATRKSWELIGESRLNEIKRLTTIIESLTKQLSNKVEIIK